MRNEAKLSYGFQHVTKAHRERACRALSLKQQLRRKPAAIPNVISATKTWLSPSRALKSDEVEEDRAVVVAISRDHEPLAPLGLQAQSVHRAGAHARDFSGMVKALEGLGRLFSEGRLGISCFGRSSSGRRSICLKSGHIRWL